MNDLLAIALDQVYLSLNLDEDTLHDIQVEEGRILQDLLKDRQSINSEIWRMTNFEVTANKPMASLDEAASYFKKVLQEHLDKNVTSRYLLLLLLRVD